MEFPAEDPNLYGTPLVIVTQRDSFGQSTKCHVFPCDL